jgi:ectoine hydroxylase-related dioxygenase (phytanoyl-CoA dioxygenase family)
MAHLTCWIALDDATEENGCLQVQLAHVSLLTCTHTHMRELVHKEHITPCTAAPRVVTHTLQYIPGSHIWRQNDGQPPHVLPITGLAGDMQSIAQTLTAAESSALSAPVAIPLKAGHASFHHPLLIHGSFANSSSSSRRATVVNFVRRVPPPVVPVRLFVSRAYCDHDQGRRVLGH